MWYQPDSQATRPNWPASQRNLAFRSTLKSGVREWCSRVEFLPTTRGSSREREQGAREVSSYDISHPSQHPNSPVRPLAQLTNQPSQSSTQPATPAQPASLPSQASSAMCCQPDRQATQPNWPARQRVSRTATLSQRSQPNWTNPAFWKAQSFCLRREVAVASASRECAKFLQVSSAAQPCGTSQAARQRSAAGRRAGAPA